MVCGGTAFLPLVHITEVKMVLVFELISDKDNVTEICTGKYHAQA
jgi:hypothetical protein